MNNRDLVDLQATNIFYKLHFRMHLGDVRLIDESCDAHENINIFCATLNLISNFADKENVTNLNLLLKHNIDAILKKKANRSLSKNIKHLLSFLVELPANEIIKQYKIYVDFLRKNAYFLDICRKKTAPDPKELRDDNTTTSPINFLQTDSSPLHPHEMLQLAIEIAIHNEIIFINDPGQNRSILMHEKALQEYRFSFLDYVQTPLGAANVIGIEDGYLILHVYPDNNQNDDNQAKKDFILIPLSPGQSTKDPLIQIPLDHCKELKKIEAPNYTDIVQTDFFQTILTSLEMEIMQNTQKFALFNLFEAKDNNFIKTNSLLFTNTLNIFLKLHVLLLKDAENGRNFQLNLSLFTAVLDFIEKNADTASNLKELLLNNIRAHTRFQFFKDEFYSVLTSIGSYSEEEIKNQYTKYKILIDQADKFLTLGSEKGKASVESLNNLALITNSGSILEVDISAKALNKFGLSFSEFLTTEKGSEIAFGVCNNELLTHRMPDNVLHSSSIFLETLKNVFTPSKSTSDPMPHLHALNSSIVQNNLPTPKKILTFSSQPASSNVFSRFFVIPTENQNDNNRKTNASNNNDSPKQGM